MPQGWLDASTSDTTSAYAIFLVRHDYAASLAIHEIKLDETSRQELLRGGTETMSGLVGSLHGEQKGGEEVDIGGVHGIAFEPQRDSREYKTRVVVFAVGDRLFESTAMAKPGTEEETFGVQSAVLQAIRW